MATIVHNNARNSTTGFTPSTLLVGWEPTLAPLQKQPSSNLAASCSVEQLRRYRAMATQALNSAAAHHHPTTNLWTVGQQVWLDAKNLKLSYGTTKLAPRRHGPFRITRVLSPVAYEIGLPAQWNIHPVFHASLLTTYRETSEHGPNYTRPPPELIGAEEEYKVEAVRSHRRHGRHQKLQYLIKWRGYPESDNTWEPAEQVHAPLLTKPYDRKHRTTNATTPTSIKTAIVSPQECPKTRSPASSSTTTASSAPSTFLLAHLSAIRRTPLTDSTNSPPAPAAIPHTPTLSNTPTSAATPTAATISSAPWRTNLPTTSTTPLPFNNTTPSSIPSTSHPSSLSPPHTPPSTPPSLPQCLTMKTNSPTSLPAPPPPSPAPPPQPPTPCPWTTPLSPPSPHDPLLTFSQDYPILIPKPAPSLPDWHM
jgi:hypothetical protein